MQHAVALEAVVFGTAMRCLSYPSWYDLTCYNYLMVFLLFCEAEMRGSIGSRVTQTSITTTQLIDPPGVLMMQGAVTKLEGCRTISWSPETFIDSGKDQASSISGEIVTLDGLPLPKFIPPKVKRKLEPLPLTEALEKLKESKSANFIESVDIALNTAIDPRRGDQMVRGMAALPHGTGKTMRICVFANEADSDAALAAGADIIGDSSLISRIQQEGSSAVEFDRCLATPEMMPQLGKIARILGPRGLMPNPKLGTVTSNVAEGVVAMKKGRVEFRVDKGAVIHAVIGKKNFSVVQLEENAVSLVQAVLEARPKGLKGAGISGYLLKAYVSSTMGPSFPVTLSSLSGGRDVTE